MSPFEALHEYKPPLLQHIHVPCNVTPEAQVTQEKEHMLKLLQKNLIQAQNRLKKYADAHRTERQFLVRGFFYLKMQPCCETTLGLHMH
jgi:GH24 family phage-related lysozyme (muramidase)